MVEASSLLNGTILSSGGGTGGSDSGTGKGSVRDVLLHSSSFQYYFLLYIVLCVVMMCLVIAALCMKSVTTTAESVYCSICTYITGRREGYTAVPDGGDLA